MTKIDRIVAMIKRLNVQELRELQTKLGEFPNWPPTAAAAVPAKPKPIPPSMSARATRRRT